MPANEQFNETAQVHCMEEYPVPACQPVLLDDELAAHYTLKLENAFNKIYRQRMHDVPVINSKLEVAVVGLQYWQHSILCIMVTPWFMNIMLLPGGEENWDDLQETSSVVHTFPSGRYKFLVGYEEDIGKYQMCSLFSPMFEFASHQAALETAQAAINALMDQENNDAGDIDSRQIENIWNGVEPHPDKQKAQASGQTIQSGQAVRKSKLKEKLNKPVSRRQLLRRSVMLDDDTSEAGKS